VGDLLRDIAVRGLADVPALAGVLAESVPGLRQHLQDVPLRDALLDPPGEDGGGAFPREQDRLVGSEEGHTDPLQVVLDLGPVVGAPRDPLDRLADDRVEAPVRAGCLVEQLLDPAVPRDRNLESLVAEPRPRSSRSRRPDSTS
jgi:hypothetical protein